MVTLVKAPWKRGPARGPAAIVAVTRTDFARSRDMPGATFAALRFRHALRSTSGALGVSLALQVGRRTTWSVSAWETEEHLRQFLHSPAHLAIVARYRAHVTVTSKQWTVDRFVLAEAWRAAAALG